MKLHPETGELVLTRIEDMGILVCLACNWEMEEVPGFWAWSCWGCGGLCCVDLYQPREVSDD